MDRHGIRMPAARAEGREDRYVYLDSNGNPQEMQVCFQWNPRSAIHGSGNVMIVRGLTPDLARELDRMIDGKADAIEGVFRQYNEDKHSGSAASGDNSASGADDNEITTGVAGIEWLGNNTYGNTDEAVSDRDAEGNNLDEDQVMLVTAVYKMDQ